MLGSCSVSDQELQRLFARVPTPVHQLKTSPCHQISLGPAKLKHFKLTTKQKYFEYVYRWATVHIHTDIIGIISNGYSISSTTRVHVSTD